MSNFDLELNAEVVAKESPEAEVIKFKAIAGLSEKELIDKHIISKLHKDEEDDEDEKEEDDEKDDK